MSRAVLKLTGFYELGVFGEDESEDFKKGDNEPKQITQQEIETLKEKVKNCKDKNELSVIYNSDARYKTNEDIVSIIRDRNIELTNK